jgi:hypothetical protein
MARTINMHTDLQISNSWEHNKKVPLNLYDQIIDDHIIFTNVLSNKNTDFQLYIFFGEDDKHAHGFADFQ